MPRKRGRKRIERPNAPQPSAKSSSESPAADAKPLPPWRVVDREQLAEIFGVHPDTITDYSRHGMPTKTRGGWGKKGQYDVVECVGWWKKRQGTDAQEEARTRELNSRAELNETKLAQMMGSLVKVDEVVEKGKTFVKAWTAQVRALPRLMRNAGVLTSQEDEARAAVICRQLLLDISSWNTGADLKRAIKAVDDLFAGDAA